MKNLNIRLVGILCLLLVGILSSCQKEGALNYTERRVVGTWEFERVNFTERWSINRENITSEFDDIEITFNADFTAEYEDVSTGVMDKGVWEIVNVQADDCATNNLFMSFSNSEEERHFQMVLENIWVTKKRLNGRGEDDAGRYEYRLRSK